MKIKNVNVKMLVSIIGFIVILAMANYSFGVVTLEDSDPNTKLTLNNGGHTDEWTGQWELLPYNARRDTAAGATFCRQKHQALRFTPTEIQALYGYQTETIVAHSVLHSYGAHEVPESYARSYAEALITNELIEKVSDYGWGLPAEGTGDMARYGTGDFQYEALSANGDIVAVSEPYAKTAQYIGEGEQATQNTYLSYILSAGAYFDPISRFGLKRGNYAGAISDTASGEKNAFLIQDSIWASDFNEAATNGINYRRVKPLIAVNLVKEAEDYEKYTTKLANYSAKFVNTDAKVIANVEEHTYKIGPFKIDYPDDTRFSYIQDIYIVDGNGKKIETEWLKIQTTSGKAYPASNETFFIVIPGSVGDKYTRINVKAEFAYISLTYAEFERYVGTGEIGQLVGILQTSSDQHEYKSPEEHSEKGYTDETGYHKTSDAWTEHFYCKRTYLSGRFEERIIGTYKPQNLFDVIKVKRQWVEDYATTYADRETPPPPTPPTGNPPPPGKDIDLTTSLGGFVWVDENAGKEGVANGIYDSTEKKVPNIIVKLFDSKGNFVSETKTDANGEYRFTGLNALKKYYVSFTYNGQYYEPTTYTSPYDTKNGWGKGTWQNNSNATDVETERNAFNNRFAVIGSSPTNYDGNKQTYTKMDLLGYSLDANGNYVQTGSATIDEFGNLINANSSMAGYVTDSRMTAYTGFNTTRDFYPIPDIYLIDKEARVKNAYGSIYNMREEANKIAILFPDAYYINLGLHPREVTDVAVNKDVDKVTVEINNHSQEYKYDCLDTYKCNSCGYTGKMDTFGKTRIGVRTYKQCPKCNGTDIKANWDIQVRLSDGYYDTTYSRELYKADYAYKTSLYGSDFEKYGISEANELQVYVTYKIAVSNQSLSIKTRIDELVDYYDKDYELVAERSYIELNGKKYSILFSNESACGNNTTKISDLNKIYIRGIGKADSDKEMYLDAGDYAYFYVTFRVLKDENGYIRLDEDINSGKLLEGKQNVVELNGYSTRYAKGTIIPNVYDGINNRPNGVPNDTTPAGIVDTNSTPGNQTSKTDIRENDADKAPEIRIILSKDDQGREITGTVWEDERTDPVGAALIADGIMQGDENKINGVTVQLVEIMSNPADDEHREFVWREFGSEYTGIQTVGTGTGSGKTLSEKPIINYKDLVSDYIFEGDTSGRYAFKSFIPGNYVIRFIYGDTVRTVVPSSLGGSNEKSYNGQDYKSTVYQNGIAQDSSYEWRTLHTYSNGEEKQGELLTVVPSFKADSSNNETVQVPLRRNGNWSAISADDQQGYLYNIAKLSGVSNVSSAKDIESSRNEVNRYSDNNVKNEIAKVLSSFKEEYNYTAEERNDLISTLIENTKMKAETGLMVFEVENGDSGKSANSYKISNVNFGLEERPAAKLQIEKEVAKVKVVLANGAILFDTNKATNNVLWNDRLVQLTMDEEIMHGATIQIDYNLKVTNVGEVDYNDRDFYYRGILTDTARREGVVTTTPNLVIDYVANNLQFNANNNAKWKVISRNEIEKAGLVDSELINSKKIDQYNTIIVTDAFSKELVPEKYTAEINADAQNSASVPLVLSQLITSENNTDDLTYRNIAEIVKTSNTVGRRDKDSIVGNQDPTVFEITESDTDMSQTVRILPPFGSTPKALVISITVVASIIILAGGIIFIKKKVL